MSKLTHKLVTLTRTLIAVFATISTPHGSYAMIDLPAPIRAFVESSNGGDAKAVVECFTKDAVLTDWGRRFEGHDGIAAWDKTDNTGVNAHLEPLDVKPSKRGYVVTVRVSGGGFNGVGHLDFAVPDGKISELMIE